ncbi:GYF domain-containing protein [Planctomicrobium sp. SH664]|uniref:GYF domain-containing protein n=1 Tax=Planctomicrobium sp. SH664 TaxID=3448125 RepID=UPI003F5B1EED
MAARAYFVKSGSKVLGPFSREQLGSLQARGRLSAEHLVSTDRRNWRPYEELAEESPPAEVLDRELPSGEEWFYAQDHQQSGPVSRAQIQLLIDEGTLSGDTLVWKEGYPEWIRAGSIFEVDRSPLPPQVPSKNRSVAARDQSSLQAQSVKFCTSCGLQIHLMSTVCPRCRSAQPVAMVPTMQSSTFIVKPHRERKDKVVAGLLALLLGGMGAHHFYLGNVGLGLVYLLFVWTFIPALVSLVEGIRYLTMSSAEFDASYNS